MTMASGPAFRALADDTGREFGGSTFRVEECQFLGRDGVVDWTIRSSKCALLVSGSAVCDVCDGPLKHNDADEEVVHRSQQHRHEGLVVERLEALERLEQLTLLLDEHWLGGAARHHGVVQRHSELLRRQASRERGDSPRGRASLPTSSLTSSRDVSESKPWAMEITS